MYRTQLVLVELQRVVQLADHGRQVPAIRWDAVVQQLRELQPQLDITR